LSLSIAGVPLHTRSLTAVASLREDGRWDVRGDVIDLRKCGFVPMTQDIQPSGIIHHMTIELIVDPETLRIDALETAQPHVAIESSERTAGECCRDPAPRLKVLEGEILDDAFARRLSETFGGALGCSHMLTLFFAMAAALPRAIAHEREVGKQYEEKRVPGERIFWRSIFIDGYEVEDGAIELSAQLSDVHSSPHHQVQTPIDRLDRHEEARVVARVEVPGFTVSQLRASQRVRRLPDLAEAVWDESSHELVSLIGHPIVPGLSKKVRALLAERDDRALVRDALLQLAPGHIQVLAAITDRWFVSEKSAGPGAESGGDRPPVGAIGGMVNSCYMWREGSPLIAERERVYTARRAELEAQQGGGD
jgi:hypothetical protein